MIGHAAIIANQSKINLYIFFIMYDLIFISLYISISCVFATIFFYGMFRGVVEPGSATVPIISLFAGILSFFILNKLFKESPVFLKYIIFPMIGSNLVLIINESKTGFVPIYNRDYSYSIDILAFVFSITGGCLGALSKIGRNILIILGQNVIGNTDGEVFDIRVAGAIFGFVFGGICFLLLWRIIKAVFLRS